MAEAIYRTTQEVYEFMQDSGYTPKEFPREIFKEVYPIHHQDRHVFLVYDRTWGHDRVIKARPVNESACEEVCKLKLL